MHAKPGEPIALVGRRDRAERIGRVLEKAGYEIEYGSEDDADGHVDVVMDGVVALAVSQGGVDSGMSVPALEERECIGSTKGGAPRTRSPTLPVAVPAGHVDHARRAEWMESLARLAGGIAHDFNNILSVISICTEEALERMPLTDSGRDCLTDIREAVNRGSTITRDLLSFSGRSIQTTHVADVNEVVSDAERLIRPVLGEGITLNVARTARDAPVRIDPMQWMSVFAHLAGNARHAMPTGGSFTIHTRDVVLDPNEQGRAKAGGRYAEISFTDTGCGIPEKIQGRIFEPFFSTQGFGKATGLGLAVVHGIVEQSGGFIELSSQVSVGTTFRIYLPIANAPPEREAASSRIRARREANLLLVEDEEAVRRIALRALERAGYTVFHARSGEDALAMLPTLPPIDLLVTDVVLPGMDGRTLANEIVERRPTVAVLYASGYTDDEVLRCGVLEAEIFFLQKPYTPSVLVQRVEYVLARASRSL